MTIQPASSDERRSDFVQSLERGLSVIRSLGGGRRELTLSEVARTAGLSRAAARRFLLTLVELGYVESADGRFSLGPRMLELGYLYLSSLNQSTAPARALDSPFRAGAVPVRDSSGSVVAALSIVADDRISAEILERDCLAALEETAATIERNLHRSA
jgi:IclR family pca regulon transcriptional regulator